MRIGIISDIHTNAAGLAIALARMGQVDELLCAGDIVYQYRFGNEVIEMLRQRGARNILGNHDLILLGPQGVRALQPHVRGQPRVSEIAAFTAGRRLTASTAEHGSPFEPTTLHPDTELKRLAEIDADYIILGHTHFQMAERIGKALVINPGSVGEARDDSNGRRLSYAVLDFEAGEVTFDNYEVPRPEV
jgi:putative phosphoesterase